MFHLTHLVSVFMWRHAGGQTIYCYSNGNQYSFMQASFDIIVRNGIFMNFSIRGSSVWWSHCAWCAWLPWISRSVCAIIWHLSSNMAAGKNDLYFTLILQINQIQWDHENYLVKLLYQVSHYIRVKKQRNIKSWDQLNHLVIRFCYIRPLYNEVPLYFLVE